mmetsp:Transcript_31683/g.62227  ORF Transcript_31683/g.62227 Transcript_31683/m.62227 type:complete len:356 (+) Transcript_31683:110-1177(+)
MIDVLGTSSGQLDVAASRASPGAMDYPPMNKDVLNGLASGLLYGLIHVVGPDHLGTLMTLSSATTKRNAFAVGAWWGLGHSFGMVFIACIFLSLDSVVAFNMEAWEYYGNYFIGSSMILCAAYFILRESQFLTQQEDGTYVATPCACCHNTSAAPPPRIPTPLSSRSASPSRPASPRKKVKFCRDYCDCDDAECNSAEESTPLMSNFHDSGEEAFPPPPKLTTTQPWWQRTFGGRDARGAVIGVFQGACCPLGMVGISFLATLPMPGIVVFLLTFMAVSAFGTALLAVCWAWLTNSGFCGGVSPKLAYRVSCCFTLSLGILWVIANYYGFLEKLNYAEAAHHLATPGSAPEHKQQ